MELVINGELRSPPESFSRVIPTLKEGDNYELRIGGPITISSRAYQDLDNNPLAKLIARTCGTWMDIGCILLYHQPIDTIIC